MSLGMHTIEIAGLRVGEAPDAIEDVQKDLALRGASQGLEEFQSLHARVPGAFPYGRGL